MYFRSGRVLWHDGSRGFGIFGVVSLSLSLSLSLSKNYPNPWDSVSSGVESSQTKVPWVNESATPPLPSPPRENDCAPVCLVTFMVGHRKGGCLHEEQDTLLFDRTVFAYGSTHRGTINTANLSPSYRRALITLYGPNFSHNCKQNLCNVKSTSINLRNRQINDEFSSADLSQLCFVTFRNCRVTTFALICIKA